MGSADDEETHSRDGLTLLQGSQEEKKLSQSNRIRRSFALIFFHF